MTHQLPIGEESLKERVVSAEEFKNTCLKLMDEVHEHGVPITVTKRGKPVVRVVPVLDAPVASCLRGTLIDEEDDIFSTGESFEADA